VAGRVEGVVWKLVGLAGAVAAGMLAKKITTTAWQKGAGQPPPTNPEHPDVSWPQALAWAIASGAAVGVARMLASRQMAKSWRKATGHLPPDTRKVS
jgi:hypothetical protein